MNEQELIAKYKSAGIVKGSLRKGKGRHASKNVVDCKCRSCGKLNRSVASSDLWLKLCECGEKLNGRKARKAVK